MERDVSTAGPSKPKSPRIEKCLLESLRATLKEEITSEIMNLLVESQKEMMKFLRPETRENVRENVEEETENETRSFYTPTRLVRISSTQNDQNVSRNNTFRKKYQKSQVIFQKMFCAFLAFDIAPNLDVLVLFSLKKKGTGLWGAPGLGCGCLRVGFGRGHGCTARFAKAYFNY